ncbi:hypothetical protein AB2Z22_002045 [Clostridium botulinum]|uniref:hypothetical protein n=1 Tax=Clostridium botulinum TaxID=1491 RepID=UPI000AFE9F79|nr:hypothetical protein [Clostridium botulinum]
MKKLNEKELLNTNGGRDLGVTLALEGAKYMWKNRKTMYKGFDRHPGWRHPGV